MEGLEVFRANGDLQFSSDLQTHFLHSTGTGTTVAHDALGYTLGNTTPSKFEVPIPSGLTDPIVAVQCSQLVGAAGSNIGFSNRRFACQGAVGTSYTFYIYTRAGDLPTGDSGLELYDENNQLTFTSNHIPMTVLGTIDFYGDPDVSNRDFFTPQSTTTYDPRPSQTFTGKDIAIVYGSVSGRQWGESVVFRQEVSGQEVSEQTFDGGDGGNNSGEGQSRWIQHNDGKIYGIACENGFSRATAGEISFDDVFPLEIGISQTQLVRPLDFTFESRMLNSLIIDVSFVS